jgi:2-polyprenyl-6-methoxyphenol hydroxylase-like FAD-dependent oxidoreductase
MQESLLRHAEVAGAKVWRKADVVAVRAGSKPEADILTDSGTTTVCARLIVAADGRESRLATLLGFERERDPPELITGGLQLAGKAPIDEALHFFLHAVTGRGSILIQNRPGSFRAYLLHHKDALPRRLSGERDYGAAVEQFIEIGIPRHWLEGLKPHGAFASFDGAHRWISNPAQGNCVLIGDAAGASDPVWGNGLSRTLRDVRLLRDHLLGEQDWTRASTAYAADHHDFFMRLRRAERLNAELHFAIGDAAEDRRRKAYALMGENEELNPDVSGLGPEARCNDKIVSALLGEEFIARI